MAGPTINPMQMMGNMMGNHPIMQLMKMMQGGGNPQQLLQQFVQNNPKMQGAMPFIQGKNADQLQQTFYNMCKERGIDPQQVASSVGVTLPK